MVFTEEYFCIGFEIVCPWNFFTWIYSVCWTGREVTTAVSTMSDDGTLRGIFPIVHRTFLLSYFRGYWLLGFFHTQSM